MRGRTCLSERGDGDSGGEAQKNAPSFEGTFVRFSTRVREDYSSSGA